MFNYFYNCFEFLFCIEKINNNNNFEDEKLFNIEYEIVFPIK